MDSIKAQGVIESLRKGIPPNGFVRYFTVGRKNEIDDLLQRLQTKNGTALLVNANYGAGKTHLLKYIREEALERNFAVSTVTLDANSGVRFNRMDQIFGAVCRNIEIPQTPSIKGLRPFFDFLTKSIKNKGDGSYFWKVSNNWKWDYSEALEAQAVFVALRAWVTGSAEASNIIEDWFYFPEKFKVRKKELYLQLVANLRKYFRDPRSDMKFYEDEVFLFNPHGHEQSWAALRDFDCLARAAGLNGMILLFDEFEDIITNIKNIAQQEAAFWNLFYFYDGKKYTGKSFFAVTPAFVEKCKSRLLTKGRMDFDYSRFDKLPTYEMGPLTIEQLEELSMKILSVHGIAYNWEPDLVLKYSELRRTIDKAASLQIQDRARRVIVTVVNTLDGLLPDS